MEPDFLFCRFIVVRMMCGTGKRAQPVYAAMGFYRLLLLSYFNVRFPIPPFLHPGRGPAAHSCAGNKKTSNLSY